MNVCKEILTLYSLFSFSILAVKLIFICFRLPNKLFFFCLNFVLGFQIVQGPNRSQRENLMHVQDALIKKPVLLLLKAPTQVFFFFFLSKKYLLFFFFFFFVWGEEWFGYPSTAVLDETNRFEKYHENAFSYHGFRLEKDIP